MIKELPIMKRFIAFCIPICLVSVVAGCASPAATPAPTPDFATSKSKPNIPVTATQTPASTPTPAPATETAPYQTPTQAVKQRYSLRVFISPPEGGSVSTSQGTYDAGTQVTITAKPSTGYKFNTWSGDASDTSLTIKITMDGNKNIMAYFEKIRYNLSISVNPPGTGAVRPESGIYDIGAQITLSAEPTQGYSFSSWSGDASGKSETVKIIMDKDKKITANFIEKSSEPTPIPTVRTDWTVLPLNTPHLSANGLTVTVYTITVTKGSNSNIYAINYALENRTPDKTIDEGSFKIYFKNGGGEAQSGSFLKLYPGERKAKAYTWITSKANEAFLIEFGGDPVSQSPTTTTLKWGIPIQ